VTSWILDCEQRLKQDSNVFGKMGKYWAEIAGANQTERQLQFIKSVVAKEGWILDLACGTGRHTNPLANEGFNVVGVDISAELLRIAKQHQAQTQLVQADMRHLPFKDGAFAAALSIDNSFGYLPTETDDLLSLKQTHETLRAGGVLVLDVFSREQLMHKYGKHHLSAQFKWLVLPALLRFPNRLSRGLLDRFYRWRDYPSFLLLQKRAVSGDGGWLCDFWVVCDKTDGKLLTFEHTARLYGLSRLQELLVEAGFRVSQVYGDYEKQAFTGCSSDRLIVLARLVASDRFK